MQSTRAQVIVTTANVCAMIFVIIAGGYLGFKSGWTGYEVPTGYFLSLVVYFLGFDWFLKLSWLHLSLLFPPKYWLIIYRYFPFGVDGMLAGSATVFFAYIGFDSVASTAEEVTLVPLLIICCHLWCRTVLLWYQIDARSL